MTDETKILVEELFQRYGSPVQETELRITGYFTKAESIHKTEHIRREDERAQRLIQELQTKIEQLTAYRISLAEQYSLLETAPTIPIVRLKRRRDYRDKKVYYYLSTFRRFTESGIEVEESCQTYPGTERNQALKDFQAYTKAHPGIIAEIDIAKSRWER